MFKKLIAIICCVGISVAFAETDQRVKKLNWDGIEVVWLEDNRFPTYDIVFYFGEGALTDASNRIGETNWMFSLMTSGTRRFTRKEIKDHLDYFGASYGGSAFHEYSKFNVSGLVKDVIPTVKKVCHLFDDANFPERELRRLKSRVINSKKNLVSSHDSIAQMSFRELSLAGSPFAHPSQGKLRDIKNIRRENLRKRLDYFNKKAFKRIYITGPKSVLGIKNLVLNECGWSGKEMLPPYRVEKFERKEQESPRIYLVTVPKANQAKIMIGRYGLPEELPSDVTNAVASGLVAGSPLGLLPDELRDKRGLTYSVGSYISMQRDYGRMAISTSTKSESAVEAIEAIRDVLAQIKSGNYPKDKLSMIKSSISGSYPFSLESNFSYLSTLLHMDLLNRPYSTFYSFPERVMKVTALEAQVAASKAYDWNQMTIVVVGAKSLAKSLKKLGPVKVVSYKKFL